jgi:hypothetical protein
MKIDVTKKQDIMEAMTLIKKCDVPDEHNFIYSTKVMQEAIDKIHNKELIGTLVETIPSVLLTKAAFVFKNLRIEEWMGDNYVAGDFKILDNEKGQIIKDLQNDSKGQFTLSGPIMCNFKAYNKDSKDPVEVTQIELQYVRLNLILNENADKDLVIQALKDIIE